MGNEDVFYHSIYVEKVQATSKSFTFGAALLKTTCSKVMLTYQVGIDHGHSLTATHIVMAYDKSFGPNGNGPVRNIEPVEEGPSRVVTLFFLRSAYLSSPEPAIRGQF